MSGAFILSNEDSNLAELLGGCLEGDCARILSELSHEAKQELRAAVGLLLVESQHAQSAQTEPQDNPDGGNPKGARAALAQIYTLALGAKTMVLLGQGKPMHEDYPHTASATSPEKSLSCLAKAEAFIGAQIEKLNAFATSFGLPAGWWMPEVGTEGENSSQGVAK